MLYAYAARFDVSENLKNFTNFLVTKQRLSLEVMIFFLYGVITCGVSNFSNILIVHAYNSKKITFNFLYYGTVRCSVEVFSTYAFLIIVPTYVH